MLATGDIVPQFFAKQEDGSLFDSTTIVGKSVVVFYFYPKDNTPGCTAQACSFRDEYEVFKQMGAEVVGISGDDPASHQKFAKRYKLPFLLLSDIDRKIRNLFGVKTQLFGLLPGRVTYVVDRNGIIQMIFDSANATKHIKEALKVVAKLVHN